MNKEESKKLIKKHFDRITDSRKDLEQIEKNYRHDRDWHESRIQSSCHQIADAMGIKFVKDEWKVGYKK